MYIYGQNEREALRLCRSIVLACDTCGHILDLENVTEEDLWILTTLGEELHERIERLALDDKDRSAFDGLPDVFHSVLVRAVTLLRCPACGELTLAVPESFLAEKMELLRKKKAYAAHDVARLARKFLDTTSLPWFRDVFLTSDPARYYTEENDHNPMVILGCRRCDDSGQFTDRDGTVGFCDVCLGVGSRSIEPRPCFYEDLPPVEVKVDSEGCVRCLKCKIDFSFNDPTHWTGRRHQLCGQKIIPIY